MKELSLKQIAGATGGVLIKSGPGAGLTRVSRDSRDVDEHTVFFALIGENNDAHSFIPDVLANGCRTLVISDESALESVKEEWVSVILVDDTTKALQRLAAWYLRVTDIKIIGVTGSVGKTTTKDLLYAACSQKYKTGCTQGNYNNHIGMPLTVLSFDGDTEVGILEMGMDKYGEIDFLAHIALPQIAVITSIGSAHIEFFGTRENIMKAKMEITNYLRPQDTLVISRGEDLLVPENVKGNYHVISSGENPRDDFVVSGIIDNGADGMEFDIKNMWTKQHFVIPAAGRHNVFNAAVAAAAAAQLNITLAESARGMEKAKITEGRLAFKHSDKLGIDIIDDTYNASPEAMKAAVDQLMSMPGERKIAVLGDMYELGENSRRLHLEVGAYTDEKNVDLVLGVGPMGCVLADASGARGIAYESKEELKKDLKNYLCEGDTVLVKASRGMALDEIVDFLME